MNVLLCAIVFLYVLFVHYACQTGATKEDSKSSLNSDLDISRSDNIEDSKPVDDVAELCKKLPEMKIMPYRKDKVIGDIVYDGLLASGTRAVPCLVDQITNQAKMNDPREAPHILDFTVGDAAVFMVHRITDVPLISVLPERFAKDWQSRGVYTYFTYVETPNNRKQIQLWWKDWIKSNIKK